MRHTVPDTAPTQVLDVWMVRGRNKTFLASNLLTFQPSNPRIIPYSPSSSSSRILARARDILASAVPMGTLSVSAISLNERPE